MFALTIEQLLDVDVTIASKTAQKQSMAPSIISVLSAQEIASLGATTLAQALRLLPGFTPITQLKGDRIMTVRGLALRDGVLVLIDGSVVNNAFDGSFDFYSRPVTDIARIEVIRGPGSALYGGYAVSSVIHIFTKQGKADTQQYQLALGGGSNQLKQMTLQTSIDASSMLDELTLGASFYWQKHDGDDALIVQDFLYTPQRANYLPPLTNPTLTPTIRKEAMEKFNGHINAQWRELNISFGHQQIISNPLVSHLAAVTEPEQTLKDNLLDRLSIAWQAKRWHAKIYWNQHESKLYGQSLPPQFWGDEDQDGLNEEFHSGVLENFRHKTISQGIELEYQHSLTQKHQLLTGWQYHDTKLDEVEKIANVSLLGRGPISIFPAADLTHEFMPQGISRTTWAAFIQDQWSISKSTNVTLGLRYDNYNDFGSTWNPRVAIVRRINDKSYAKVLYGKAFNPPAFSQLFDATPALTQSRLRGNITLKPTEIETFELQLGYDFDEKLKGSINLFDNKTDNEVFFDATPGIEKWQNSGQRKSRGLEVELKGSFAGLDLAFANYSYQDISGADTGAGADIHAPHRFNLGGIYALTPSIKAGFTVSYYSSPKRELLDTRDKVDEKWLAGLNLTANDIFVDKLTVNFNIDNLFDQSQFDETELSFGLLQDIPRPGRTFTVNLKYRY